MTRFCRVLAVSASLLRCSFAATGEATMRVKLSKPMLGDCSMNRRRTNTERITNDAAEFWKPPKSYCSDLLTQRDGLFSAPRMVSRPAGYPRCIYQPVCRHYFQKPPDGIVHLSNVYNATRMDLAYGGILCSTFTHLSELLFRAAVYWFSHATVTRMRPLDHVPYAAWASTSRIIAIEVD